MIVIKNTILPVAVLWEYREFKRDEVPAPMIPMIHGYTTDEITQYVNKHGLDPVELSVFKDRALLTDGNHRIVAARNLGYKNVPVVITVYFRDTREIFYEHTIKRFKMIDPSMASALKQIFPALPMPRDCDNEHVQIQQHRA